MTDTGEPVFLPFRMSCYVISNLVVTVGMLTPNLGVRILWDNEGYIGTNNGNFADCWNFGLANRQPVP